MLKQLNKSIAIAGILFFAVCRGSLAFSLSLTVGMYPHVPRLEQFQTALVSRWKVLHPEVPLVFVRHEKEAPDDASPVWDGGYEMDPPPQVDVFVFDAIHFEYYKSRHMLERLSRAEVQDRQNFYSYAIRGVQSGRSYYAIPQLGCTDILFFDKQDKLLAKARALTEIRNALGECSYVDKKPPKHRGLMFNMSGKTTDAVLYLAAKYSLDHEYPIVQPTDRSALDQQAIGNLHSILAAGSYRNASDGTHDNAAWFNAGYGRAYVGFSESLSALSEQKRKRVDFKLMPLSDRRMKNPLFYTDAIGISPETNKRGTRQLAVELANLMGSTRVMVDSLSRQDTASPQYLLPVRKSVLAMLARHDPVYLRLKHLLDTSHPLMLKLDQNSKPWLNAMGDAIRNEVLDTSVCHGAD